MKEVGVSQTQLAKESGITQANISLMSRGLTKGVDFATLDAILAAFRRLGHPYTLADLLVEDDAPNA